MRPPPSVSNHPLNLQIQLVPPSIKDRTASGSSNRRSVDYSNAPPDSGDVGVPLARSQSSRSNRSDASTFYAGSSASSTSMTSLASTATGSSVSGGRRMIVPLYNLSAHNVMTNTVLDAGTDAKVAKFHKRGLEILGLAVLECVEVWPNYPRGHVAFLLAHGKENVHLDRMASKDSNDNSAPHTPTSSALSLSSAGSHQPPLPPHPGSPATPTANAYSGRLNLTPTPTGAKKIFGKIFKKKDSSARSPGHVRGTSIGSITQALEPAQVPHLSTPRDRRSFAGSISPTPSILPPLPNSPHINHTPTAPPSLANQPILQPPILDIQPTLSSPIYPPVGRPTRYVWIVKKWLKGNEGGLFGGVIRGAANIGANMGVSGLSDRANGSSPNAAVGMELRFEWIRGVSKNIPKGQSRRSSGMQKRPDESQTSLGGTRRSRATVSTSATGRRSMESTRSRSPHGRNGVARGRPAREPSASRESRADSLTSSALSSEDHGGVNVQVHNASPKGSVLTEEPEDINDRTVEDDDGEESDPEDSETPWTCSLVISAHPTTPGSLWEHEHLQREISDPQQHLHPLATSRSRTQHDRHEGSASAVQRPGTSASTADRRGSKITDKPDAPGTLLRLKVGTLSPAPHHPKVVAQIRCPFPLPDIEVDRARLRKRVLTPSGHVARALLAQDGDSGGPADGLILTAEEIKDVVSCTAFWVVVREGFGGVGKVNRKGDGWRIRG